MALLQSLQEFWNHHPWVSAIFVTLIIHGIFQLIRRLAPKLAERQMPYKGMDFNWLKAVRPAADKTKSWIMFLLAFAAAVRLHDLHTKLPSFLYKFVIVVLFAQVVLWIFAIIDDRVHRYLQRADPSNGGMSTSVGIVATLSKGFVLVLAVLAALDVMGINVTALVAGVGIGGIAIAFAVQGLLQDLFASLTIVFDQPFRVGQTIRFNNISGTVERVGLKTTRVRSIDGELLVLPNNQLLSNQISNFTELKERRCLAVLSVTYDTPVEKVERIADWLKAIVENTDDCRFDRAHFRTFAASSLDVELAYFVGVNSFSAYLDRVQSINLAIMRKFSAEGVSFAFPTQTIHVAKE